MSKNLTIKDIALLAGVSITTVSRVLNKHAWVSEKTRARVDKVIAEHQFSPNLMARGMISRQSYTLAVIVSDITNPYFVTLVAQIQQACLAIGYKITLYDTQSANRSNGTSGDESAIFQSIIDSQIDGVIVLGGHSDYAPIPPDYLAMLETLMSKMAVVVVGQPHPDGRWPCVMRDHQHCVELAVNHLITLGLRDIGFIGGSRKVWVTRERIRYFRAALQQGGITPNDAWICLNNFYPQHGYQAIETLWDRPKLPQALVAINDRVAMGAIRALSDRGIKVPQQVAVISCERFPGSEYFIPRLTSVDHHNPLLGQNIIKTMMAQLDGILADETHPTVAPKPTLIAGESA
ncbi:LacI family DNA-binding transcriptional regulator [Pantoea agglomerans]